MQVLRSEGSKTTADLLVLQGDYDKVSQDLQQETSEKRKLGQQLLEMQAERDALAEYQKRSEQEGRQRANKPEASSALPQAVDCMHLEDL